MSSEAGQRAPGDGASVGDQGKPGGTIRVTFKPFSVIRDVVGADLVEVEVASPGTVQDVLDALLARFGENLRALLWDPELEEMTPFLIRLNDELIRSKFDTNRSVANGDDISFIYPIGGG